MAQRITTRYHALDTSVLQNDQIRGVISPGIYSGYFVRVNAGASNYLDIIPGADSSSVLITSEGIKVEETEPVLGAVLLDPADANLSRYDLVVAEFRYAAIDVGLEQTYKVIKGRNQASLSVEPVRPVAQNQYQIPLAYVKVRPRAQLAGTYPIQVLNTDIYHVARAKWTKGPEEISSLRPEVAVSDNRRIYVYPGIMANSEGTRVVEFSGGYSAVITDSGLIENAERYYLFGLSDQGEVAVFGSSDDETTLPEFDNDLFPIAIVRAKNINGSIRILSLKDIRFPFARRLPQANKTSAYQTMLSNSVFRYLRVERFDTADFIRLSSASLNVADTTAYISATIDGFDNNLAVKWAGTTLVPSESIKITTEDMMSGGNMGVIKHFMLLADSAIANLKFVYSVSSPTAGFTTNPISPGTIVRVPGAGATRLYIRFIIPAGAFVPDGIAKINSYGLFLGLSDAAMNAVSITELGIDAVKSSVPNLIANGDFYYWSVNTTLEAPPNLASKEEQFFRANDTNPLLADGWQLTNIGASFKNEAVSRIIRSTAENAATTAMKMVTAGGTQVGNITLEYRIPAASELVGKPITFALSYAAETPSSLSIGIATFTRTSTGLEQGDKVQSAAILNSGDLTVTLTAVGENVDQISFFIVIAASSTEEEYTVFNARAAVGVFGYLNYSKVLAAPAILAQYYERGRAFLAQKTTTGAKLGTSAQFGTPKSEELGELTARTIETSASDRSSNITGLTYDSNKFGLVLSSTAAGADEAVIDVDWEAYVRYEETVQ
jgi:hypothetical protein